VPDLESQGNTFQLLFKPGFHQNFIRHFFGAFFLPENE
jgi:hypothetical protein